MTPALQVSELSRRRSDIRRFLRVPYRIYRDDPHWVAPLLVDLQKVFTDANPFFEHAQMQLWVASHAGEDVGRIAGIIDRHHNDRYHERTAFFGFYETIHDPAVSTALFDAVRAWARAQGMDRLRGPANPTLNDEAALLVDAFDAPPVLMMTYNPPYYVGLLEREGFRKAKDFLAYKIDLAQSPMERLERVAAKFSRRNPDISIRPVRRRSLTADLQKVKQVYNAAWDDNWGFVPMTDAEVDFMAARLRPMLVEGLVQLAETEHGPVGFLLALPDFNQAIKPLRGRLLSPGVFNFLAHLLGWRCADWGRVIILGVIEGYRGRGIEAVMLAAGLKTGFRIGFKVAEASWVLEDNLPSRRVIELFGGVPYKTYRLYDLAL